MRSKDLKNFHVGYYFDTVKGVNDLVSILSITFKDNCSKRLNCFITKMSFFCLAKQPSFFGFCCLKIWVMKLIADQSLNQVS